MAMRDLDEAGRLFGAHLGRWLARRNMRRKDLADGLHGSPSMVTSWIKGRNLPNLRTMIQLADVLSLSRRELVRVMVDVFDLQSR